MIELGMTSWREKRGRVARWLPATLAACVAGVVVSSPTGLDPRVHRGDHTFDAKKAEASNATIGKLLATLVQTHTEERIALDDAMPTQGRFEALLQDRVTGERHAFDPRLLGLLRAIAARHEGCRIELVSGYRSPKLNEMMRKKGRHVASKSQHSLGHAVDFRVVPPGEDKGIDPRELEKEIRALGWEGGVGVYTLSTDWFVHADVGRNRRWDG